MTLEVLNGPGISYNNNSLTASIATDDPIPMKKNDTGIIIPDLTGPDGKPGGTLRDNITIIGNDSYMQTNRDVVEYIYSMSAYKVTSRTSPSLYRVDRNTVKTMDDIMFELNHVVKYSGVNMTNYFMEKNNLLQLRDKGHGGIDKTNGWLDAIDDGNRYYGDSTLALFVITECEHHSSRSYSYFTTKLSLQCLWSDLSEFEKGNIYTGTDSI